MPGQLRLISLNAETPEEREAVAVGALTALAMALLFAYPSRAYPLQSLFACGLLAVAAVLLGAFAARRERGAFLRALGSAGMLAIAALAVWAFVRWLTFGLPDPDHPGERVRIPAYGSALVSSLALAAVAAALGAGLSCLGPRRSDLGWGGFRRLMVLVAIAFSFHGIWQFHFGYAAALAEYREVFAERAVETDLMRESMQFMLEQKRIGGYLGNPNVFAALLSILAAFSLSMWSGRGTGVERGLGAAAYALCVYTLFRTESRGGLMTFAAATAGSAAILVYGREPSVPDAAGDSSIGGGKRKRTAAPAAAVALALGFILMAARAAAAEGFFARMAKMNTVRERFYYWEIAREIWATNWPLGAGPGSFQLLYPSLKPAAAMESRYAHSWVMHTGAELGIAGAALFAFFWLAVLWRAWGLWGARHRAGAASLVPAREGAWLGLGCGLLAFNGLFEYSLQLREFLVMAGLMGGGVLGLAARESAPAPSASPLLGFRAAGAALGLAACLAFGGWMMTREQVAGFFEIEAKALADAASHAEAATYFAKAARWMPENESYLSGEAMAMAYDFRRNVDPALEMLERAQKMNPLSARVRQYQAQLYLELMRLDLAAKKMDEAVRLYPYDAGHRLDRAEIYLDSKRPAEARLDVDFIEENKLPIRPPQKAKFERIKRRVAISEQNNLPAGAAPGR